MISISLKEVNPNVEDLKDRKNAFADAFISKIIKEDEIINYLNRYHFCTATFQDDYRNSNNIKTVAPLIKIDIDDESNYQIVLGLLNMSGYKYVKVPSASYEENKLHKLHILVFTQKQLSINPSIYSYQVDNFLYHLGINPKWIDYKVSINPVSYFAPYRAKFGKIDFNDNETIEHFEIIDDEVSELIDGDYAPITDEVEVPKEFKNHNVQSGYILPSATDGKIYSLDELNSSDKATYLKLEGFIPYKGEIVSIKEVSSLIWAENDNTKRYSNFGCPVCNKNHTMDSISTSYAFAYISKNGEIIIQCNGNSCSEKSLYIIPNQEIKELFDVETGMSISKPIVGSSYLIDNVKQQCINEYKNSFNFTGGYKFVLEEKQVITSTNENINPLDLFYKTFSKPQEEINKMEEQENELIDGILFESQICTLVAMANGGKTLLAQHWSRELSKKGYKVTYIVEDGGIKSYIRTSKDGYEHGYNVISSNANEGQSPETLLKHLKLLVNSGQSLNKMIFIFDTLKKFTDILDKKSNKDFFNLVRAMTMKGATILNLAHANKYLDDKGNLVFEGTGDIKNDTDSLYYMYSYKEKNSLTQYALLDMDKSRSINAEQEVYFKFDLESYTAKKTNEKIDVKLLTKIEDYRMKYNDEIIEIVSELRKKPLTKNELYTILNGDFATSRRQAFELINVLDGYNWEIFKTGQGNEKKVRLLS